MEYELEFTMNEKTTYQRYYDYNLAAPSTTWDSSLALETKQCFYFSIIVGREHINSSSLHKSWQKTAFKHWNDIDNHIAWA